MANFPMKFTKKVVTSACLFLGVTLLILRGMSKTRVVNIQECNNVNQQREGYQTESNTALSTDAPVSETKFLGSKHYFDLLSKALSDAGHNWGGNRCSSKNYTRHLPSAILIGERKCSTDTIVYFLKMVNRKVIWSEKEAHFFDKERNLTSKDFEKYKQKMDLSCPGDITIEKTPNYFRHKHIPKQIYDMNPNIKLILSLRDPIDRAVSEYQFLIRKIDQGRRYAKVLRYYKDYTFDELSIKRDGTVNSTFDPLVYSCYDVYLEHWLKTFPLSQIHIVDADHFTKNNPSTELMKLEEYLGLDPKCTEDNFYLNEHKGFYCLHQIGCMVKEKGHKFEPLANKTLEKLIDFFKPHVQHLHQMIGKKLSWMPKYLSD